MQREVLRDISTISVRSQYAVCTPFVRRLYAICTPFVRRLYANLRTSVRSQYALCTLVCVHQYDLGTECTKFARCWFETRTALYKYSDLRVGKFAVGLTGVLLVWNLNQAGKNSPHVVIE